MPTQSFLLASLFVLTSLASAREPPQQPEEAGGWNAKKAVDAKRYMVAAANPLAARAGLAMLDRGGSAIDAAIATQLVLGLVEPQSSGLGGGAYLLHFDARRKRLAALDARESAPAGVTAALFLRDGRPMEWQRARSGGWAVGVPGVPRLLEVAHARWGKLEWATLFEPAIALAEHGFRITPRLARLAGGEGIGEEPAARAYLLAGDGRAKPAGTLLRNPEYARTLRALAAQGADAFYTGDLARTVVEAVRRHPRAGSLAMEDLAAYRVRDIEPICAPYRSYRVCGPGPSTYGGIATLQVLGALARFDMAHVRPGSSEAVHLVSESERLAYADRARYGADDRFVDVPAQALVEPGYLASRSALIEAHRSMRHAQAGEPRGVTTAFADDDVAEAIGTSHIAIVDRDGNAVSMTTSVEGDFGTRIMAGGFFLNNTLTDFNFEALERGRPVANAAAAGKRPRSSMAPMMVFDAGSGAFEMALGSPGGSLIIDYVAKVLVATLDWGLDLQSAIDLPNFGSRNGPTEIEKGTALEGVAASLAAMGHDVRAIDMTSGVQGIRRTVRGWQGAADPRREGVALGR
jgi:gamma-glutamyltranspeptidase / glutathione hydrolase